MRTWPAGWGFRTYACAWSLYGNWFNLKQLFVILGESVVQWYSCVEAKIANFTLKVKQNGV